jgi:excisionase family DNA binding protein
LTPGSLRGAASGVEGPAARSAEGASTAAALRRSKQGATEAHPSGFEPLTYGSGVSGAVLGESSKRSQSVGSARVETKSRVQPSRRIASVSPPFAARVLQTSAAQRAVPVGVERLLMVKEAAERLRVCTATVYGLCKGGKLGHARVGSSIRIPEAEIRRLGG